MLFNDTYRTISAPAEGIFRDRGSKFIGYAYPIRSEEEVKTLVQQLKAEHPKARHHCWALRLSPDRSVFRINDDGEPSGTAGRPILNTLLSQDITQVLVVVVRYFGGTLLGVPGLINAYKTAAQEALSAAQIIEKTINDQYLLQFEYLQMNEVMKLIKDKNLNIISQQMDNSCEITIEIRKTDVAQIIDQLEKFPNLNTQYLKTL
ncbi:MAG: IMPACT family protein [Sphingobacteriaceae bacterium]